MPDKRRVKFKTLDNQVNELEVEHNISIFNLKKIIMIKNGMPSEGQRLIFQGKQLKNEHLLSDYIKEDDLTIHLMCLTPEQLAHQRELQRRGAQPQTQPESLPLSQPSQQPFIMNDSMNSASIVSILHNMMNNNTSVPIQNIIVTNNGVNGLNSNSNQQPIPQQQSFSQGHAPITQPLSHSYQNILHPNSNYPITTSSSDARYDDILHGINSNLNLLSRNINKEVIPSSQPSLPLTNSNQNILTAISRSLRYYNDNMNSFIPQLSRLADIFEREQLVANSEERAKGNKLVKQCLTSLDLISQSSNSFNRILSNSNFGNAPNTGFVNVINTEIGVIANLSMPLNQLQAQNQANTSIPLTNQTNTNSSIQPPLKRDNLQTINQPNMTATLHNEHNHSLNGINSILKDPFNDNNLQQVNNDCPSNLLERKTPVEVLKEILNNSLLKQTKLFKETLKVIPVQPHSLFASFANNILGNMTFQEISYLFEFNLSGFLKQFDSIGKMISSSNRDNLLSQMIQFIINAISMKESDKHKRKANRHIDIQIFLKKYCIRLFDILFEKNIEPNAWESAICNLFKSFIKELYTMLIEVYSTEKEGSLFCLFKASEKLLTSIIGDEWLKAINEYDGTLIAITVEEVINVALNHQTVNESFPSMSMTEILNLASNDNERLSHTDSSDL